MGKERRYNEHVKITFQVGSIEEFHLQNENPEQIAGYAERLRQEYPYGFLIKI